MWLQISSNLSIHQQTQVYINNSNPVTSNGNTNLPTSGSNWIVNGQTTGFFIPTGNNQVQLFRGLQATPINTSNTPTNTASANASKAWINHGSNPNNATYQYVVVPATTPAKMQALADSVNQGKVYEVLANNLKYHAVIYKPSNTSAYSFFEGDSVIKIGYIEKVTKPCLIITKEVKDTLIVRITNPDLNTVNVSEPSVDWNAAPSNVSVTLTKGLRFLESSSPFSGNTVSYNNTVEGYKLDFVLNQGNYTQVKLIKDIVLSDLNPKALPNLEIYPNPASEQVIVNYYSPKSKTVDITLVNSIGQISLKLSQLAKVGTNQMVIDTKSLKPGFYILNVDNQKAKLIIE
ncbi:hypothetical protein A5893_07525 [Pedobacter psychrophilus]|uniref:Secretion system C-terminal sorting domain-containing protein n=2 Tax=Pedobacter psychrophilus TaxID=1826909 RepID=A0A179DJU2_9SPHI|nr:hypothetical protein A5893_07525 [Pedobacter psychrophilus]